MDLAKKLLKIWDSIAEEYNLFLQQGGDAYQLNINWPSLKKMLGDIRGKKVLDAGCGNGYYTSILNSEMGGQLIGIDGSKRIIELAKKQYPNVPFKVHDLTNPLPYDDEAFDIVFSKMVIMDLPEIKSVIAEFHRVLKTNGTCLISIIHPTYPLYYWLKKNGTQLHTGKYEEVSSYFLETFTWHTPGQIKVPAYTRPLKDYLNEFCKLNFHLSEIDEPEMSEDFISNYPKYSDRRGIPVVLNLKFIKQ